MMGAVEGESGAASSRHHTGSIERHLAGAAARAALIVDLATRPIRRDFTTMLSVECAFIDYAIEAIANSRNDPALVDRLIEKTKLDDVVMSKSSHQMRPRALRTLLMTAPIACLTYPVAKFVGVGSYLAIRLGFSLDGGAMVRNKNHAKQLKEAGNSDVNPNGSTPAPTPGITADNTRAARDSATIAHRAAEIRSAAGHPGNKIKKVVVILMENHTYDDYFGRLAGGNGDPNLFSTDDPSKYLFAWWPTHGSFSAHRRKWMDVHEQHDASQIPFHWKAARKYALFDDHYCFDDGPSTPNHIAQVAGWSHNMLNNYYPAPLGWAVDVLRGQPEVPPFPIDSTPHHLEAAGLTWGNYGNGAFADIAALQNSPNNLPSEQFAIDARSGKLRDVSYLVPPEALNEHAPNAVWPGMQWVAEQVQAIVDGGHWEDTAILVSWDDYGGYHDHIEQPDMQRWVHDPRFNYGLGKRVPLLVLSPWVKSGYLWRDDKGAQPGKHRSFLSTTAFIRDVFGLGEIDWKDNRPEWTKTDGDNLLGAFDFNQQPLSPPDTSLPQRPDTSLIGRTERQWHAAGKISSFRALRDAIKSPLGFHEAVAREALAENRNAMGLS